MVGECQFETLLYEERDGVAWVTLNRPGVHNAFNVQMQRELRQVYRSLRHDDDVRVVVLTGAGDRAFCTGIDRTETMGDLETRPDWDPGAGPSRPARSSAFHFDDPGVNIGPKSCELWKPVIAAVNGMACGGAFYMLGEVDFIIAAEPATFFDPHVTYGMTAAFEPIHMLQRMPIGEIFRLSLLGNHERMSAQRAFQLGLVSEVVPQAELHEHARWAAATTIALASPRVVQGTLRAIWAAQELSRAQALSLGFAFVSLGNDREALAGGQAAFAGGRRVEWRLR
jgi:enoyl-CoA hydratase/carnithine racemase